MANSSAKAREQQVFVVKETTAGTLEYPAAGDILQCTGMAVINQQPSSTDSNIIVDSRDVMARFADRFPAGNWSIPSAITVSGAGVAPDEDVLLECLMGTKTIVASTSVTYTQANTKASFSMFRKIGHTVVWARGCTVDTCQVALERNGGASYTFSGGFMAMGITGTCETQSMVSSAATSVTVADAKKYSVGGKIEFVESEVVKNNSASGYTVTARNTTTNVLTISPGAEEEIDSGSTVRPYLPTGTTTGTQLANRKGKAVVDSTDTTVRQLSMTIKDNVSYFEEEITDDGYPQDYAEGTRDIAGDMAITFRQDDAHYFDDGYESEDVAVSMVIGDTAGAICTLAMPKANVSVPAIEDADITVALRMSIKALGNTGNDSLSIAFT